MAEKQVVRVVGPDTKVGKHIRRKTPVWAGLLGEEVEVDPKTAVFVGQDLTRVRVWAKALTGKQTGVTFTPFTSMLVLTPEQEALFRHHAHKNTPAQRQPAEPKQAAPPPA